MTQIGHFKAELSWLGSKAGMLISLGLPRQLLQVTHQHRIIIILSIKNIPLLKIRDFNCLRA